VKVKVGSSAYVLTMNNCEITLVSKFVCSTFGPRSTLFRRLGPSLSQVVYGFIALIHSGLGRHVLTLRRLDRDSALM